jgi:hypothetical protein
MQGELEAKAIRRTGGKARAAQQTADAVKVWEPYVKRFRQLVNSGKPRGTARRIVKDEMVRAGFTLQYGAGEITQAASHERKAFPSNRTIAKWLK